MYASQFANLVKSLYNKVMSIWTDTLKKRWSDNALEDYFLELVIQKHIIDREIKDLITIVEESNLHDDYKLLIKRVLFGEKNIYIENWGTLEGSLIDIVKTTNIRWDAIEKHGIVLEMILHVIEDVFDISDEFFNDFLLSEDKEDVEHQLIILMKRILDFVEQWLKTMLEQSKHLDTPIDGHIRKEFDIIQQTLVQYPEIILTEQRTQIESLKHEVEKVHTKTLQKRKNLKQIR